MQSVNGRGSFAEYAVYEADATWLVPDNVTDDQAATTPIPFFTACQLLFVRFGLPYPPTQTPHWLFVHSGASSVGHYVIQIAKMMGMKIITTASPHNHDLLKSLGASICLSYKDPNWVNDVKTATNDHVRYAIDCVSRDGSVEKVIDTIGTANGKVALVLPWDGHSRREGVKVEPTMVCAYSYCDMVHALRHDGARIEALVRSNSQIKGQDASFGPSLAKAHAKDLPVLKDWTQRLHDLAKEGQIKFIRTELCGGLEDVEDKGFKRMQEGGVSATKLVFKVA